MRTWLYTIATNTSLRALEQRPQRVLPIDYGAASDDPHGELEPPLVESVWVQPVPDSALAAEERESVELAFVAALQLLPPRQRAVLILRDVLGFSGSEVAAALETTEAAVYSALQRAHATIDERLPERTQQATMRDLGDEALRELAAGYVDAWERADIEALSALLTEDVVLSMPPLPDWYRGRDAVLSFLRHRPFDGKISWPGVEVAANGQLAVASYRADPADGSVTPHSITVLDLAPDGRIASMTAWLDGSLFERFGLPTER
jgi:RNA polymerase sigma-70 factor (ECF subfamily)